MRRMTVIMFTDIKDFSKRMDQDECLALSLLNLHNNVLRKTAEGSGGRVIKTIGDSFLIEFGSAVDAVQCAVEAQRRFIAHNRNKTAKESLLVRIAVHVGDCLHENNDIFGEEVNIASRLLNMTAPGRIWISRMIHTLVKGKAPCTYLSLGHRQLKGIAEPIEIFQVVIPEQGSPGDPTPPVDVAALQKASPAGDHPLWRDESPSSVTFTQVATAIGLFGALYFGADVVARFFGFVDFVNGFIHGMGHTLFRWASDSALFHMAGLFLQVGVPLSLALYWWMTARSLFSEIAFFWVGQNLMGIGLTLHTPHTLKGDLAICQAQDWLSLVGPAAGLDISASDGRAVILLGCLFMTVVVARKL